MPANLRRVKIAAFASAALSSGLLVAADVGGVISGAVVDSSGAAVPLARVSLALEGSSIRREIVSGPSGKYRAGGLPAGSYTVTAWSGCVRRKKSRLTSRARVGGDDCAL